MSFKFLNFHEGAAAGAPTPFTRGWTWLGLALASLSLFAMACSDDATPGECIDAAQDAGVPDAVVEWMKSPSNELGSIERIAIRETLEKFGLGDACSEVAEDLGFAAAVIPNAPPPSVKETVAKNLSTQVSTPSLATSVPMAPATPLPPNTPLPSDTTAPSPDLEVASRSGRQMDDYVIPQRHDDYPEVIGLELKGVPGNSSSRFVILLDEHVHVTDRESVYLRVRGPDGYEDDLELRTLTSRRRSSRALEFGPVEESLTRVYSLEGSSYVRDSDDHSLEFDSGELQRHPNALFLSPNYAPDIQDRSLVRCAAVMEFNGISPILVRSLRNINAASLGDTERFEWLTTLIEELDSVSYGIDRVELDLDQGDFLQVMRHPCAALWSEPVSAVNADKRNAKGDCRPNDPDVVDLLETPYLSLNATDRLVLKRELGGWNAHACLVYYPQIYTGLWIPLPLGN